MATPTHNLVSEPLAIGRRGTAVISDMPECPYAGGNVKCEKRALPNAVAFRPLTLQLACATDSGGLFPRALFRRLFIVAAQLHFAIHPFALTRSEEHTSELQSLMRISYAVFCLKKQNTTKT